MSSQGWGHRDAASPAPPNWSVLGVTGGGAMHGAIRNIGILLAIEAEPPRGDVHKVCGGHVPLPSLTPQQLFVGTHSADADLLVDHVDPAEAAGGRKQRV